MIKDAIGKGATVEEATKAAKQLLGAPEEVEVKIEILKMPQKKILGIFGGNEAEVKASYEAPDKPDREKKEFKKDKE